MLANWFVNDLLNWLGLFGLAGQFAFMMRFVVQWFASERRGRSYVPIAFWYLSLCGGAMLFSYALMRRDPVIMLGQALGMAIYIRNLVLIYRRRWRFHRRRVVAAQAAAANDSREPVTALDTDTPLDNNGVITRDVPAEDGGAVAIGSPASRLIRTRSASEGP
jgi:lipid-A-disaccharide synthase-like uncharacterized protein